MKCVTAKVVGIPVLANKDIVFVYSIEHEHHRQRLVSWSLVAASLSLSSGSGALCCVFVVCARPPPLPEEHREEGDTRAGIALGRESVFLCHYANINHSRRSPLLRAAMDERSFD